MLNTSALLDAKRNISMIKLTPTPFQQANSHCEMHIKREKDTRNISIHDCEIEKNSSPTNDNELLTLQQSE